MLKIRLSRVGRKNKPQYRVVVAEHGFAVKGRSVESLGHYSPISNPKTFAVKKDRVEYWIAHGAQPSSTVAGLLKKYTGLTNMEKYMKPRLKDIKSRKELKKEKAAAGEAKSAPAAPAVAPVAAPAVPKEEPKAS